MAQPPTKLCFGLSPGEIAGLVSGSCLHIYSFENTTAKSLQAEQEEMQIYRTVGVFPLTGVCHFPACDAHLAQGLAGLPMLGSLCWGRVPNPNLACRSSALQNVPSTCQIFRQQSCKWCECATPPTSMGASENIKGVCEDVKIPISPYTPYPPYFTDFLYARVH